MKILEAGKFQSFSAEAEAQLEPLVRAMKIRPRDDGVKAIGDVAHALRHALDKCDSTQVATKIVTAILHAHERGVEHVKSAAIKTFLPRPSEGKK